MNTSFSGRSFSIETDSLFWSSCCCVFGARHAESGCVACRSGGPTNQKRGLVRVGQSALTDHAFNAWLYAWCSRASRLIAGATDRDFDVIVACRRSDVTTRPLGCDGWKVTVFLTFYYYYYYYYYWVSHIQCKIMI